MGKGDNMNKIDIIGVILLGIILGVMFGWGF
jgi:hypothetical protein